MAGTSFGPLILTNACDTLTAEAWATSGILQVTAVQAGSGFPGPHQNPENFTALRNPVMYGQITGINDLIPGQLTVRANVSSANAPETFDLNEVGIFASVAGGTPQLVAYATTGADTGVTLTPGGGSPYVADFAFLCIFSQAIITSGIIQLVQVVGLHAHTHLSLDPTTGDPGIDEITLSSTTSSGLCPANPNDGTTVLTGTNPPSFVQFSLPSPGSPVLVNGNFKIAQGLGLGTFADNWKLQTSGFPHVSVSLQAWDNSFTPDQYYQTPPAFARIITSANYTPNPNDFAQITTAIEGCDFLTSYGNAITISALIRGSTGGSAMILISTGGTPTQYYAYTIGITTAFQRFSFTIPAAGWPSQSLFDIGQQNQVSVYLSVLAAGGINFSLTSFDTSGWSATQGSGSAWGTLRTSGNYVDVADVRWDVATQIALPIFESYGATLFRCMRYQQNISWTGTAVDGSQAFGTATFAPPFGAKPNYTIQGIANINAGGSISGSIPSGSIAPSGMNEINISGSSISAGDIITASIVVYDLLF
jgi:hypothetical protein